ncbi:MAG: hypothetical protein KDC58_13320 [Cyclobacteriaceae bacterium]|nr:hypothetical protein [Cyclobacteriaceae bacterium]
MRIFDSTLLIIIGLLVLTSCSGQSGVIEIDRSKIGGLYEIDENGREYAFYNGKESFKLNTLTSISFTDFDQIIRMKPRFEGVYSLYFELNDIGILKFKEMTERNIGKPICFVIGNKIMAAPTVQVAIPNGQGEITIADKNTMDEMVNYLKK